MIEITADRVFALGDVHGAWHDAERVLRKNTPENALILQLGDFGYDPRHNYSKTGWPPRWNLGNRRMFFIDGNHEDHDALPETVTEVHPGVTYLPKGTLLSINGVVTLTVGGAETVSWDRGHRTPGKTIFASEGVPLALIDTLLSFLSHGDVHVILSHTAPGQFAIPDIRSDLPFEDSRSHLNYLLTLHPKIWYFGHYHSSAVGQAWLPSSEKVEVIPSCVWMGLDSLEVKDLSGTYPRQNT